MGVLSVVRKAFGAGRRGNNFEPNTTSRVVKGLSKGSTGTGKFVNAVTDIVSAPAAFVGVGGVAGLGIGAVAWYVALMYLGVL